MLHLLSRPEKTWSPLVPFSSHVTPWPVLVKNEIHWFMDSISLCPSRGHKRKLDEDDVASESSKESSNEDEEGSSSEADEMAAALEAELNDFI